MRKSLLLLPVACGLALLASCATRSVHYTLTKTFVSQSQMFNDTQLLNNTLGVNKVITNASSGNVVTMDLYLDESNPRNGLAVASDLGYQLVKN